MRKLTGQAQEKIDDYAPVADMGKMFVLGQSLNPSSSSAMDLNFIQLVKLMNNIRQG